MFYLDSTIFAGSFQAVQYKKTPVKVFLAFAYFLSKLKLNAMS